MKKIVLFSLALMVLLSTLGLSLAAPLSNIASTGSYFGCMNKSDYQAIVHYVVEHDDKAADQAIKEGLLAGTLTLFKNGESVYVEDHDYTYELIQVRRLGETENYWAVSEAVPGSWDEFLIGRPFKNRNISPLNEEHVGLEIGDQVVITQEKNTSEIYRYQGNITYINEGIVFLTGNVTKSLSTEHINNASIGNGLIMSIQLVGVPNAIDKGASKEVAKRIAEKVGVSPE
jgi:hypothetical protein